MSALHFEDMPGPEPLVCLHGWGMNLRVFDALRATGAGAQGWRAIDLPGHGASLHESGTQDFETQLAAVRAALPAAPCRLLGWSLGGQFALELARREPARVRSLVLVATTPRFAAAADWPHGMAPAVLGHFRRQLAQDSARTLADFITLQVRGSRNTPDTQAALHAALRTQGTAAPAVLAQGLTLLETVDLRSRLAQVRQPALVVSGQHDRITPAAAGEWLAAQLPAARHVVVPRAGHAPFLSHAAEFAALLAGDGRHGGGLHAA